MGNIDFYVSHRPGKRAAIGMGIGLLGLVAVLLVAHSRLQSKAGAIGPTQATPGRSELSPPAGQASHSAGDAWTDPITGIKFRWVPAGSFEMGSAKIEDANPVRSVNISRGFWIGQFEVTQAQWRAAMNDGPSSFKGDNRPMEQVSRDDVDSFIRKLNSRGQSGFRLPTEAEWEYACRAGTKSEFCYGDSLDSSQSNFDGSFPFGEGKEGVYREETTAVGSFRPNAWGLYDMHGNVWELCLDWYDPDYYKSCQNPDNDPSGPSGGSVRVIRGGAWRNVADECRSAYRSSCLPGFHFNSIGFRLAKSEGRA